MRHLDSTDYVDFIDCCQKLHRFSPAKIVQDFRQENLDLIFSHLITALISLPTAESVSSIHFLIRIPYQRGVIFIVNDVFTILPAFSFFLLTKEDRRQNDE